MLSKKYQFTLFCFLTSLGIILFYNFDPASPNNYYPPSLSRNWGGFYCAGCGTMRALHQLLHGNLYAALKLNPLLIIALPYFFYWIIPTLTKYFYNIILYSIPDKNKQLIISIIIAILYGFLRNIPEPPFSWLAPAI